MAPSSARNTWLCALLVYSCQSVAATYYVAPTGTDSATSGTQANPFQTIGYGTARLTSGDTLIVGDGLYRGQIKLYQRWHQRRRKRQRDCNHDDPSSQSLQGQNKKFEQLRLL
ncbi:hypothetical protein HC761_01510 [bacterium]|nr:hypothetical protein [bacterium]